MAGKPNPHPNPNPSPNPNPNPSREQVAGKLAEEKLNKRKKAYEAKKVRARPTQTLALTLTLAL